MLDNGQETRRIYPLGIEAGSQICYTISMYTHMKHLIRTAAFVGIVVPPTALAAVMLQLPADAIAGLGFDLLVSGLRGNEQVAVQMDTPDGGTVGLRGEADESGEAYLAVKGSTTQRAGTYAFETDGATSEINVLPDAIDPVLSTIDVWTPMIDNDGDDAASVTVTLRDQYGNALPGRIATLVSGRGDDDVSPETNQTDDNGEQHFSVRSYDAGTISLRAIDLLSGIPLVDSATIRSGDSAVGGREEEAAERISRMSDGDRFYYAQVANFDVIDGFAIDVPSDMPLGEEASKITISAVDMDGNTVEDYVGTVVFSSTDPDATLPNFGKYTFKERDLGKKDFPLVLKFKSPGEQTFRVEDQNDRSIFGESTIDVEGDGDPSNGDIVIVSPKDGDTVSAASVTVEGTAPAFTNLVVLGGASDIDGSSDGDGRFSIIVPRRADQREYTLRVQDEDRRYDSGPVLVRVDADGPAIDSITFKPEQPEEGEKVLAVVKSEAGLESLVLSITHEDTGAVQEVALTPTASAGTYQAFFTAPKPGEYQPSLVAVDKAGNDTELRTTLTIGSPALLRVEDVAAEGRVNSVSVSWTETDEEVDQYRVYVGENPSSFGYFLDTDVRTNRATVAGLTPGKQYYFAVTSLLGDRESDKSVVAAAKPLGLTLTVAPEDQALRLQWSQVDADTPLSHFLLEYGANESQLVEIRLLNRELTEFALRDLLNGVEYVLRLTPVTSTGKKLAELSAIARGTPNGSGFHPAAGDGIPFEIDTLPGELQDHPPVSTPSTGIPRVAFWAAIAAAIGGVWLYLHKTAERKRTQSFLASLPHVR